MRLDVLFLLVIFSSYATAQLSYGLLGSRQECPDQLARPLIYQQRATRISASTEQNFYYKAIYAILYNSKSWRPSINDDKQHLQVDFKERNLLRGVATQGRRGAYDFVSEYFIKFSDDNVTWAYYTDGLGMPQVFFGNVNGDTVKYNNFTYAIVAQHIRFQPIRWNGYINMRVDVFGCPYESETVHLKSASRLSYNISGADEFVENSDLWLQMRFRTEKQEGLLFYAGSSQGDYLVVELQRGKLYFHVNLGKYLGEQATADMLTLKAGSLLDDGQWHDVELRQDNRNWNLTCDRITVFNFTRGVYTHINLDQTLEVGGVDTLTRAGIQTKHNFTGCMERVLFNSIDIIKDTRDQVSDRFRIFGNIDWKCGISSKSSLEAFTFAEARSHLHFKENGGIDDGIRIEFYFRSYNERSMLMAATYNDMAGKVTLRFDEIGRIELEIKEKELAQNKLDESVVVFLVRKRMSNFLDPVGSFTDGVWHNLTLEIQNDAVGQLSVDGITQPITGSFVIEKVKDYYVAGGVPEEFGFLGCMRDLVIGNSRKNLDALRGSINEGAQLDQGCLLKDRCNPDPCEHGSVCNQDWDKFKCDCQDSGYTSAVCHRSLHPLSCEAERVIHPSKTGTETLWIDLDGSGELGRVQVECDFKAMGSEWPTEMSVHNDVGETANFRVTGFSEPGAYTRNVTYKADRESLREIQRRSTMCSQFISLNCEGSRLLSSPGGSVDKWDEGYAWSWWVGFDYQNHYYWGGSVPGMQMCACGVDNKCDGGQICNCDSGKSGMSDSGQLTYKPHLPVMQLRLGDTGSGGEKYVDYSLGPLVCKGDNLFDNAITFNKSDSTLTFAPIYHAFTSFDLRFQFRTTAEEGVFVHMVSGSRFLQVRLYGKTNIEFRYNAGSGVQIIEKQVKGGVTANKWHTVQIERNRREATIQVDDDEQESVIEPQDQTYQALVWDSDLVVGADAFFNNGFVGCIRALQVNGHALDLRGPVERGEVTYGVRAGCVGKCDDQPCLNNGICHESYDSYFCDCTLTPYRGYICGREVGVDLTDGDYIRYELVDSVNMVDEELTIAFSTWQKQGILIQIVQDRDTSSRPDLLTVSINPDGGITVEFDVGFEYVPFAYRLPTVNLCNGQQHEVFIRRLKSGTLLEVQIDDYGVQQKFFDSSSQSDTIINNAKNIHFGANSTLPKGLGFIGCLFRAKVNEYYPFREAFQDPRPSNLHLTPPTLRESKCGFEEIFHDNEVDQIRPTPPPREDYIIVTPIISTSTSKAIIGAIVALIVVAFLLFCCFFGRYLVNRQGDYQTREAADAGFAPNQDAWVLNANTGQPDLSKKKEFLL